MLLGRERERAQIVRLLGDAADGRGGVLVLRGEAGIGKTALLEQAVEAAEGFRVLRALGVESEAELPFAGLHELVLPLIDLLERLPAPQSKAMKAALALEQSENPDRFSAYAATLGLLAAAAAEQHLLCLVDDAHWLDQASAEALVFAARRIDHDPIVMLFAVRDPVAAAFSAPGLSELRLGGLTTEEAKALLAARAPPLLPTVVERLVEAASGNPLAAAPLLAADADAEQAFAAALELHEHDPSDFERARTHLAYGERLRRLRQRRRAREQLHTALESFERLGARPWTERARAELRASGEHLRRRGPAAHEQLTPQELQVSLAAAEGLTNKEIGARLFLSPKTVEFHLRNAYRKLDVRSRGELIKLFAEQVVPAERLPA